MIGLLLRNIHRLYRDSFHYCKIVICQEESSELKSTYLKTSKRVELCAV